LKMARTAAKEMAKKHGLARSDGGPAFQRRAEAARVAGVDLSKARMSGVAGGVEGEKVVKKRYKPGMLAIREIRKYQQCTEPILRMAPFMRLVRDRGALLREFPGRLPGKIMRFKMKAVEALREITECRMVRILEDAHLLALHRRVKGVQTKDLRLAARIRDQPAQWVWENLEKAAVVKGARW